MKQKEDIRVNSLRQNGLPEPAEVEVYRTMKRATKVLPSVK